MKPFILIVLLCTFTIHVLINSVDVYELFRRSEDIRARGKLLLKEVQADCKEGKDLLLNHDFERGKEKIDEAAVKLDEAESCFRKASLMSKFGRFILFLLCK